MASGLDALLRMAGPPPGDPGPVSRLASGKPKKPSALQRFLQLAGQVTQTPEYQGAGVSYTPPQSPANAAVSFASRFPVAGEMVDAYDLATAIRDRKPLQGGLAALSLALPFVSMAAMKRGAGDAADAVSDALPAPKQPIRAFHGSPHDFDKFDLSKIGTGEGAQAYGHGLYFAENMDVAKSYQPRNLKAESAMLRAYKRAENAEDYAAMEAWERAMMHETPAEIRAYALEHLADDPAYRDAFTRVADELDKMPRAGSLTEVAIHADPNDFLDWDAPISQQPPKVREALSGLLSGGQQPMTPDRAREVLSRVDPHGNYSVWEDTGEAITDAEILELAADMKASDPAAWDEYLSGSPLETQTGGSLIRQLGTRNAAARPADGMNVDADAARALLERGIPGVRYFDGMSRATGEGTRNYVLFDDSLVEILRKYGLAGLLGAGVVNRMGTQQESR